MLACSHKVVVKLNIFPQDKGLSVCSETSQVCQRRGKTEMEGGGTPGKQTGCTGDVGRNK